MQHGLLELFHTAKVFFTSGFSKFILSQNSSNCPHGLQPAVIKRKNVDLCPISETHWNQQTTKECIRTEKDL